MFMAKQQQNNSVSWSGFVFLVIALFVVFQAFLMPRMSTRTPRYPTEGESCVGEPIEVDYEYDGALLGPHECKVQCGTEQERYILYTNGMATQCEPLPGCSDWGEDNGVKCELQMSK